MTKEEQAILAQVTALKLAKFRTTEAWKELSNLRQQISRREEQHKSCVSIEENERGKLDKLLEGPVG
jgi:hypothetical protein